DTFSSTHSPDYIPASQDYFPALSGNTSSNFLEHLTKDLLASLSLLPFYDNPYVKVVQAYDATNNELPIPPLQAPIAPPTILPPSLVLSLSPMFDSQDFLPPEEILPKDTETSESPTPVYPISFSMLTHIFIRDYYDSLTIRSSQTVVPRDTKPPIGSLIPLSFMPPKRTTTSEAPSMTQDDIKKLVADSVFAALEAQAANMANIDNTTKPRETPLARKCTYKEFMSCQPFYFNGMEGTVGLIHWFERTESWNSYAKPIGIEQADKITWTELKRLLTTKYCPRTKVKKIEDELYNLVVKGNDLKTYIRRFHELATLCPTIVPNSEKLIEVFIEGLPKSIEGNVTTSKPQTLEEAINITQRLMDQVTKHNFVQETNDRKRKFDDSKNTNNNNYPNDCNNNNHSNNRNNNNYQDNRNNNNRNNDHHHQQNKKQETFKTYVATNGYKDLDASLDEDPATGDEGLAVGVEGLESDRLSLEEEAVLEGQQQAAPVVRTAMGAPLGLGYEGLRRRELALKEHHVYCTFEVEQGSISAPESERPERIPPLPEWTSGSLLISPSPCIVPSPVSSPMILVTVPSSVATHTRAETEGFLIELELKSRYRGDLFVIMQYDWRSYRLLYLRGEDYRDVWILVEACAGIRGIGRADAWLIDVGHSCLSVMRVAMRILWIVVGCLPQCLLTQRVPPRLTELRAPECPYHFLRISIRPLSRLIWMGRTLSLSLSRTPLILRDLSHALIVATPTSLPKSTPPTLVPILCKTARMAMRVPPVMSSSLSASMAKVATMFESAFRKRFRSSYESSPSLSLPDLPLRKCYQATSELVEDSKEDDDEEDEEIEDSLDSDSVSEDAEDEGPIAEDKDPTARDEGLAAGVEGLGTDDERHEEEEDVPRGQQQAALAVRTAVSAPLGLGYEALRRQDLALDEDHVCTTPTTTKIQGFLTELGAQVEMQGGLIHDHTVRLEEQSPALFERYDRDIGELFTRSGAVRDDIFSQRCRFMSLEHEHERERTVVTFGAL
nr:hypothetical protein [Tanacetum cinerariifolium]